VNLEAAAIRRAREVATAAHQGQVDKAGSPYIEHPAEVAHRVRDEPATVQVVAWLHDVVEDTPMTVEDVEAIFGSDVSEAVDAISRRKGESGRDYYARVAANPIALRVKEADLGTNTDPWRTRLLEPVLRERLRVKYEAAYLALGLRPGPQGATPPTGRIFVDIGDIITRAQAQAMVAWVGAEMEDVGLLDINGATQPRGWLVRASWRYEVEEAVERLESVDYLGTIDDWGRVCAVSDDWTVTSRR
jgi:hypothetical protein